MPHQVAAFFMQQEMQMLVKDVKVRTLASGDKSGRLVLETLYPEDIKKVLELGNLTEIKLTLWGEKTSYQN